jgi:anti-sigma factor RsiW
MCDERERLIEYLYDEVDGPARREFERHLETCGACRDEVSAFGSLRTDLLAWDVPARDSVWKPFAPARLSPWWREVPAWAMAAAAAVIFAIGAAGGIATRAFVDHAAPVVTRQAAAPMVPGASSLATPAAQVAPGAVSQGDLDAFRAQLVDTMRSELDARVRLVSTHQPVRTEAGLSPSDLQQIRSMLKSGNQRDDEIFNLVVSLNNNLVTVKSDQNARINALEQRYRQLADAVSMTQTGGKQ